MPVASDKNYAKESNLGVSTGFPPVASSDARILLLGSMPGQQSLKAGQYYAHPQNAFWPIMQSLFGVRGSYTARCRQLAAHRIALWDVLRETVRPGSLDADIRMDTAAANDFQGFLAAHTEIDVIGFNGKKAESLFRRFCLPSLDVRSLRLVGLPSSSPAYASISCEDKCVLWQQRLFCQNR
ncbi:MAG TPA: DNA-deoxyinosine glycosylase [Woeseiaceae bacterium]|nr:DNA-deoxyinosine glycosylase [Woeseiaceae bacterium]